MLEEIFQPTHLLVIFIHRPTGVRTEEASGIRQGDRQWHSCAETGSERSAFRRAQVFEC